jgi:uncharacterized lipoprotein
MKKLIFAIVVLALTGCGLQWVNRSNPYANYQQDDYACKTEALRLIPNVRVQQQTPTTYTTDCSRLGSSVSCTSTPQPNNDSTAQSFQDMNTNNARNNHANSCMRARGWYLEKKPS